MEVKAVIKENGMGGRGRDGEKEGNYYGKQEYEENKEVGGNDTRKRMLGVEGKR